MTSEVSEFAKYYSVNAFAKLIKKEFPESKRLVIALTRNIKENKFGYSCSPLCFIVEGPTVPGAKHLGRKFMNKNMSMLLGVNYIKINIKNSFAQMINNSKQQLFGIDCDLSKELEYKDPKGKRTVEYYKSRLNVIPDKLGQKILPAIQELDLDINEEEELEIDIVEEEL